jgi:hypothetical protein
MLYTHFKQNLVGMFSFYILRTDQVLVRMCVFHNVLELIFYSVLSWIGWPFFTIKINFYMKLGRPVPFPYMDLILALPGARFAVEPLAARVAKRPQYVFFIGWMLNRWENWETDQNLIGCIFVLDTHTHTLLFCHQSCSHTTKRTFTTCSTFRRKTKLGRHV